MPRRVGVTAVMAIVIAYPVCVMGCSRIQSLGGPTTASVPTTIRAKDGHSEVMMPAAWSIASGLNEQADLQIHNSQKDISFIILTEERAAFADDMTYHEHSDLTRKSLLSAAVNPKVSAPEEVQVGGRRAVRYRIDGISKDKVKVTFIHITVDGEKHFYQLIFSMGTLRIEQVRADIEAIVTSIRPLP